MTKEEAIDILYKQAYNEFSCVYSRDLEEATDIAIDAIKNDGIKSPWIKCSERMPPFTESGEYPYYDSKLRKEITWKWESSDRVFVMCSDGGANINEFHHNLMIDGNCVVENEYSWVSKLDVVAWMPIPKFKDE